MKQFRYILLIVILFASSIFGQENNLKEDAIKAYKSADYEKAIKILEEIESKKTNDPEIYYLLGFYSHYLAYDSRPLVGYGTKYSDKVIGYLDRAIELDPNYGNAYYFIMAEYGARAIKALEDGNSELYVSNIKNAYDKGGLPLWLIEKGRNTLKSCEKDAILIVGGDAEFNPIKYLQVVEKYRTDVTVIPYALLNRPWYVEKLRVGVDKILRKAPIGFSRKQVFDMHPYKWDTLTVEIPISKELKEKYNLSVDANFEWEIKPNLIGKRKKYLSPDKAVLASIIENNKWERTIYFSIGCHPTFVEGLTDNFELNGMVNKLLPIKTLDTKYAINSDVIEKIFLNKNNFKDFKDVEKHNMPRVSRELGNYYSILYQLARKYNEEGNVQKLDEIVNFIENNLQTDVLPVGEKVVKNIRDLK